MSHEIRPPDRPIAWPMRPLRQIVRAWRLARISVLLGRRVSFGSNVAIGRSARFLSPGSVRIGDNVSIGAEFHCEANLVIGPDVLISSRVAMIGRDHRIDDPDRTIYRAGRLSPVEITLEGDNLVGFGVIVIGPARIGRGCVIGAGAVVTGDLPGNTVCVGVPAKPIRPRFPEHG
jgi:acetyltransferase-like isoleucine patch superfamily enzyme